MKIKSMIMILAAGAALMACQDNLNDDVTPAANVQIEPIITRATETNFEEGDKIGLSIRQTGAEAAYADNALLTFAGKTFTGTQVWYTDGPQESELVAYYPYAEGAAMPATFAVKADQTAGLTASDFMMASKEKVVPTFDAVSMIFKHKLSQVVINVDNRINVPITKVTLQNTKLTANIDWAAKTVAVAEGAVTDITPFPVEAGKKYAAIVVPQTAKLKLAVELENGKVIVTNLVSTALISGGQYTVTAAVFPDDVKVSISGEIENWQDMGAIQDEVPVFAEHDGSFDYYGENYKTITLSNGQTWMAENMRYVPDNLTPSSDPTVDSHIWYPYQSDGANCTALTDAASVKKFGYLYDYYAAFGVNDINADNFKSFEGVQGICPKGWHIPTRADFMKIIGYTMKTGTETGPTTDPSALFFDTGYKSGSVVNAIKGGWGWNFAGHRNKTAVTSTGSYSVGIISGSEEAGWNGNIAASGYLCSTGHQAKVKDGVLTNIQFFDVMSTINSTFAKGKVMILYSNFLTGYSLRCIKDAPAQ